MAEFLGNPKVQYFATGTNVPLEGGKLYTYVPGVGTVNKATYPTIADADASTNANTNPVILDARGEATVVLTGPTKLVLKDSSDSTIWTEDHVGTEVSRAFLDENGNEYIKLETVGIGAVNELTFSNAFTDNRPTIQASGSDTNIGIAIATKGSGTLAITGNTTVGGTFGVTGATTLSSTLAVTGDITSAGITVRVPIGTVSAYLGASAPTNYLELNGQAVSRTTYATLFALISTAYGVGDGVTTFNIPNMERRTIVGAGGTGTATLANTVGATGGAETHTLSSSEMPAHTHSYSNNSSNIGIEGTVPTNIAAATGLIASTTGSTGGGGSHNNMQPSMCMRYIVKAL